MLKETFIPMALRTFGLCSSGASKAPYESVEPFHLFRYLDEQAFRYNERKGTDADRFREALSTVFGRRLTFAELTGETVLPTT